MKMLPYLLLTVALAVPARAQVPTPVPAPVFPSALRARLHGQILALAPRLRLTIFSSDFDGLALSAARIGDFELALRLVKSASERDNLWQWRTAQFAVAGKGEAALDAAGHIQNIPVRADALLVAARFAVDKGKVELAKRDLKVFSNLKDRNPGEFPHSMDGLQDNQLVQGGYLWARVKEPDTARRLWKRAWPMLLAKA